MEVKFERECTQEIKGIIENATAMCTLGGAQNHLIQWMPNWFIYKGSHHVAIHHKTKGPRYAVITE